MHRELAGPPGRGRRRHTPPVRPRRRHPPERARAGRCPGSVVHRRREAIAPRRDQLRFPARPRGGGAAGDAYDPVLRDVRIPGHLSRWVEGGDLPPGRPDVRRRPQPQRLLRRRRVGALPRGRGPLGVRGPGRGGARAAGGHDRAVVGRSGAQRRAAPRQQAAVGAHPQAARPAPRAGGVPLLPRWIARSRVGRRAGAEPLPPGAGGHRGRRRASSRTACSSPSGSALGGWSLHIRRRLPAVRPQPLRQDPSCARQPRAARRGRPSGRLRLHQR